MARRYAPRRRSPENRDQGRSKPLPPEQIPPRMKKRRGKGRFDLILFAALAILIFFVIKTLIGKPETTTQPVTNENGSSVDFPIISEVMSSNRDALAATDGEYYDWIEVYNPTENDINLAGYSLSDDMENPMRFVFPSKVLKPGEFAIVFASGGAIDDPYHAEFRLSAKGEDLFLFDAHQNQKDHVKVAHLSPNTSYARDIANKTWVKKDHYTPGFFNDEAGWEAFLSTRVIYDSKLKINEVMSANRITMADSEGDYNDWVELANDGDQPISLKGYGLSDSNMSTRKWVFPDITINPGEYVLVFLSGKDMVTEEGELHANFRLNSMKEDLIVSNIQGQILDQWKVEGLGDDRSMGRVEGSGTITYFTHPTPGFDNTEDGYNAFQDSRKEANKTGLLISEVQQSNSSTVQDNFNEYTDWIELYNNSDEAIDLNGYGLSDSAAQLGLWKFPENTTIKPHEYKVVYASGRDYKKGRDMHTNFKLDTVGEPVVLTAPDDTIVDTCVLSPMPYDMSYGRANINGRFEYMQYPTPGEKNGTGWPGFAADPIFQVRGGNYADPVVVSFYAPEGTKVYYTTNGEDPNENSTLYRGPFQVDKTTVVRARAYADNKLNSNIVTATYFIGVDHKLPIVSIVSDPDNLFSDHSGIYAFGDKFDKSRIPFKGANFNQDWEVGAHIEMYEIDSSQVLNQNLGLRIFGAYSRAEICKSFALVARQKYDQKDTIQHAIFPDRPFTEYKSVILRNGASEWFSSKMRDAMLTSLTRGITDLDVQAYYPVVVYLNGEYWGVYFFREKINKYYLQQHHGIDPENVDILYGNGKARNALVGDNKNWAELKEFVTTHDLSDPANYKVVTDWVDVDNYMDWVINEIYCGNTDTGNMKYYREKKEGAKWRWFYYDVDWAFWPGRVTKDSIASFIDPEGHGVGDMFETWLILGLLDNAEFKQKFIERFAYHINVTYNSTRVIEHIDEIAAQLDPEMPKDRETWDAKYEAMPAWYKQLASRGMSYKTWTKNIDRLRDFARKRPDSMRLHLVDFFDIDKAEEARLFGE